MISQLWANFQQVCGQVVTNPAAAIGNPVLLPQFADSLVIDYGGGVGVYVSQGGFGLSTEYTLAQKGPTIFVDCVSRYAEMEPLDTAAFDAALRQMFAGAGAMTLRGGLDVVRTATGGFTGAEDLGTSFAYEIQNALPDGNFFVSAMIDEGSVALNVYGLVSVTP